MFSHFSLRHLFLSVCTTGLLNIVACSGSNNGKATELQTTEAPIVDGTEEELFRKAKDMYEHGRFVLAKDTFNALRQGFPLGPYAEYADIKAADSKFELYFYDEAAVHYEEILKEHPSSDAAPYVMLMAARSNQLSHKGTGRDPKSLERAKDLYNRLLNEFPNSMYTPAVAPLLAETMRKLAEHHEQVLGFYSRSGNPEAYAIRKAEFDRDWAPYLIEPSDPEETEVEADEKKETESETPSSSPEYVKEEDLTEIEESRVIPPLVDPNAPQILKIECRELKEALILTVYLDREMTDIKERIQNDVSENLSIRIGNASRKEVHWDCFGPNDLRLLPDGELILNKYGKSARILPESDPIRLNVLLQ